MKRSAPITALFLDIGGVLLTDGWDHHARKRAARNFKLKFAEMEDRHHLTFDTYEEGKLTLEEYLERVLKIIFGVVGQVLSKGDWQAGGCKTLCIRLT
jgi:putative hydrolase of the HAD superfamily